MQTPKAKNGSSDVPRKGSPRAAQQLKITGLEPDSTSSSSPAGRTPKDKSPKTLDRRSPRSPASEKKRLSRISELEVQLSQLQDELKSTKEQLSSSESCKKQATQDAEDSKEKLLKISSELEDSQRRLHELSPSKESCDEVFHLNTAVLASAVNVIHQLKHQIEVMAVSEAAQAERAEITKSGLENLKGNLVESFSFVEKMKNQFRDCEVSEAENEALASGTIVQLETAKRIVEELRSDGSKTIKAYEKLAEELETSKTRISLLEDLVSRFQTGQVHSIDNGTQSNDYEQKPETSESEGEICSLKSEVERLRHALNATESKFREERNDGEELMRKSYECQLKEMKLDIEELKANLMDKETELQCILAENESLRLKLQSNAPSRREIELENDLKNLHKAVDDMKSNLISREMELQDLAEENKTLKLKMKQLEQLQRGADDNVAAQVEKLRSAEKEAVTKLGLAMEEAEKSNLKVARVSEQLQAAQAANSEMEAELRRLKVQSDQWRKAAEAAAAMLSMGNNGKYADKNENPYSPSGRKVISPYSDEANDDDLLKKKNGNVLKKIGVLWKKPHK